MRTILKVEHVEQRTSPGNQQYTISHLLLDDGEEAEGYGANFSAGDKVEVFLHWGKIKAKKKGSSGKSTLPEPVVKTINKEAGQC